MIIIFKPTKIVELTATFPNLSSTTDYSVQQVAYNTTGNYTDGNPIVFIGDDTWSSNIPIGFNFCFYNNIYSSLNVGDNGIVRFGYDSSIPEGSFSSITNTTPSPSLVRNAIFGGFQDMLNIPVGFGCATGENCGTISYLTIGTAPFRKCIINFNEVNHFNCTGFNGRKSTFQIVLYETTNIIDINVREKPITCSGNVSANGNSNSLIGLNNASGTLGIAPPNRNTGSWAAIDESYQFIPSGASATTLQWFNAAGTFIGSSNPIDVIPTVDTFYTVRVNYNTCTSQTIQSIINIDFDLNYPVAPNLTRNYCDATLPFPDEIIDVEAELVDPTDLAGTIKTLHNTLAEANLGINPLTGMNAFNMTNTVRTFYYRETIGDCYVTGSITLRLFQTPTIADQEIFICDLDNNNTQNVFLPSLTTQIVGYTSGMTVSYYQNQANAIAGVNPFTTVNVTNPPGFYDVFVRFVNTSNPQCFSVSRLTLRLSPNIELAPVAPFCITNPNFDNQEIFDLTTIPLSIITGPASVGDLTINYFTSLAQANANSNPILNPANHNITINLPATNTTLYISAAAPGFCRTVIPVVISFCEADGGDDGSGGSGGNGGYGGFGACLNTGDPIPSFDLNLVYSAVMLPITPAPTPLGFYTTLVAAQTQDPTFLLTPAEVSNFTPTVVAPELFDEIFVRFTDSNGIPGIRRIILPVKYRQNVNRDIEICDTYNDGNETIDLTPYIQEVELLSPGESVTAYANFADYLANTNPVTSVTIVAPNTIVYVKAASFGCDSNYNFNFILNPYTVNTPILEQVCDIDADGVENYDLSVLYTTILSSYPVNSIVSIHATLNEAFDESSTITTTTTNYPVNPTTNVWFRIEPDPLALPVTCPIIQPIDFDFFNSIDVNPVGIVEYCDVDDDGQVVTSNLNSIVTGIVIETPAEPIIKRLYTTLLAAQNNDPVYEILPDWDSFVFDSSVLGANVMIYLYLENSVTGCDRIIPINIVMQSFPLNTINTVRVCDFENDGSEVIQDMSIFNAQITANYFLYGFSYFENMSDAVAGTNEIPNNFTISNNTIVYVKITSGTLTDCYRIIPITIEFDESPIVTNAIPLICDNLGDGTEIVNLNSFIDQIVTTPSNYTITYHQLENDALQNLNAFSNFALSNYNVTSFDVTNISVPVFVRITNSNGCFSIARLAFERNSLIDAFDTINFTCDISLTNELQGEFDLPSLVPRINGTGMIINPNDYIISYHSNLSQATSGSNPIVDPSNYIVIGDQTSYVFIRFLDPITSCFTVKRIELQIYNLPKFVNSTYDVCDDNLDGIYLLDLVNLNGVVVEDPTPFIFEYFNTQADAFAGINQITNFQNFIINVTEFPKTIYVKGTNSNNCSKVKSVIIENKPLVPLLTNTTQIIECDSDNNGVEFFDLTSATNTLTSQTGVSFQYFTSLNDLQLNVNPIANPNNYQNLAPNPSVIYVRLAAPITNCDNWATINLVPFYEEYAFPSNVTFCDNNADGNEIINLTETVYTILSNFNSSSINLAFYTSLADANASINSIADPENYNLTNFSTPLFVRITNIANRLSYCKTVILYSTSTNSFNYCFNCIM
ncbi:MAG: hypothetical protein HC854_00865 [Flavobacterium sp.]|nr:hypothetical protein [Flavobacterium sp.]